MQSYEIRILKRDFTSSLTIEGSFLDDCAAVEAAKVFAQEFPYEVWRDLELINQRRLIAAYCEVSRDDVEINSAGPVAVLVAGQSFCP
jgi:hypothetical protein